MSRFAVMSLMLFSSVSCTRRPTLKAVNVSEASTEATVTTISSGTVEAEQQAVLGFSTTGRIAKVNVKAGDKVQKGDNLAELDNKDLVSIANEAKAEMNRSQQLYRSMLISKSALDTAKKNHEVAQANLDRAIIHAPFSGLVTEVNLEVGELFSQNAVKTPLRLVDLQERIIKGEIDEIDLGKVKIGQNARVKVPAVRPEAFKAIVNRVVPYVSTTREQDRSSQIELKITEAQDLIPVGASADVEIVVDTREKAPCLPARTILGIGKERYVYQIIDSRLKKVPVVLGVGNYEKTEITSGLKVGDLVAFPSDDVELKEGLKVKVDVQKWL